MQSQRRAGQAAFKFMNAAAAQRTSHVKRACKVSAIRWSGVPRAQPATFMIWVDQNRGIPRTQGDRGYDSEPVRILLRWLGITPVLAARNTEHGSGLGVYRWFVERTISWLHSFGRLRRRLDRLTDIQEAFLELGCSMICLRFLMT